MKNGGIVRENERKRRKETGNSMESQGSEKKGEIEN